MTFSYNPFSSESPRFLRYSVSILYTCYYLRKATSSSSSNFCPRLGVTVEVITQVHSNKPGCSSCVCKRIRWDIVETRDRILICEIYIKKLSSCEKKFMVAFNPSCHSLHRTYPQTNTHTSVRRDAWAWFRNV
jgi:hypothetical protein